MSLQNQRNIPSFGTLISHRTISILGKSITLIGIAHNFSTFYAYDQRVYMYMNRSPFFLFKHGLYFQFSPSFLSVKTLHADHFVAIILRAIYHISLVCPKTTPYLVSTVENLSMLIGNNIIKVLPRSFFNIFVLAFFSLFIFK